MCKIFQRTVTSTPISIITDMKELYTKGHQLVNLNDRINSAKETIKL